MWLLAFSGWILLLNHVLASDTTSQQNDIIPDQALQIPYGMFCFFTLSELIFRDQMQQVASSAYRVGAGRLSDVKMISSTSYSYESLWGAYYFVQREDYTNIIQYAKFRDTVAFVSTMEIETLENESGLCIVTDLGLQPNTYPSTQDCSQCYGSGGSNNMPSAADYQQELSSMGVPAAYFRTMGNLPTMQNSSGSPSGQTQGSQTTPSVGGSASGQTPSVGASAKGNVSPNSLSGPGQGPPLGASAQGNLSSTPSPTSSPTPSPGLSAQGNLSSTPSPTSSPTPSAGLSAQGNLQAPSLTGSSNAKGQAQGSGNRHQLRNPYTQTVAPPTTDSNNTSTPPAYAPFQNQFVPQSPQLQPVSSSTGSPGAGFSGGVYQPQTNFSSGSGGGGGNQQTTAGFQFASYSGQYTFLSGQCGNSFMNNQ